MSAHRRWRAAVSRGIAPLRVSTLRPARGPKAMRYVTAPACSGRSVPASSASVSDSAVIEDIVETRAEIVLVSLRVGDAVHMCREVERAGLGGRVLRLSICFEENAALGVGHENTDGMFVAAGYFAALESDVNGAFKERYLGQFGERAPALNSASQSVYEGFVHLHRQAHAGTRQTAKRPGLPGLRDDRREAYDAGRNPIFLGEVQGLGIRPVRRLIGEPG